MNRFVVELSQENVALARREAAGAVQALGGRVPQDGVESLLSTPVVEVELADADLARGLAGRLALARRVLAPVGDPAGAFDELLRREAGRGAKASFRPIGHPSGGSAAPALLAVARRWVDGGGRVDLERPERRFWLADAGAGTPRLFEEVGAVDRAAYEARRMPKLPFRRPVSLPPRRARAAANLAGIRPGDRVVDPFVGTGALLLEAALLGARVSGVDVEAEMVRGTNENLAHFGLSAERLEVADAAEAAEGSGPWDAVLTDPPYGRASTTGGEDAAALVARVLPRWAQRVRPGGRIVLVGPGGPDPPFPAPWRRRFAVPDRVHRALTREFRVYERDGAPVSGP